MPGIGIGGNSGGGGVSIPAVAAITRNGRPVSSAAVGTTYKVLIPTTGNPPTAIPAGNWTRDGVDIPGATGVEYTTAPADAGRALGWAGTGMVGEALGPVTVNVLGEIIIQYAVNTAGAVVESVTFDGTGDAVAVLSGTLEGSYVFPEADLLAGKSQQIAPASWDNSTGAFTDPTFIYPDSDVAAITSTVTRNGVSVGTDLSSYLPLDNAPYAISYTATNTAAAVVSSLDFRPALSGVLYNGMTSKLTTTEVMPVGTGVQLFGQITLGEPGVLKYAFSAGGTKIQARHVADGSLRFQTVFDGQKAFLVPGPFAAGTKLNFILQYDNSGVGKPGLILQVGNSLPTVVGTTTSSLASPPDIDGAIVGWYAFATDYFNGKIHRIELRTNTTIIGPLANQAAITAAMRQFADADGFYVDPAPRNAAFGEPKYIATAIPADHTAGLNPGTAADWTPNGTFSGGIPAQFQDVPITTFDSAASAGAVISPIYSQTGSTPTHTIVSQPAGNHYSIDGGNLTLQSARAYDGTYDEVVIRTADDSESFTRTHQIWAGQPGQDTAVGRVSLVKSRDNVYTGEHVDLHLEGLTSLEKGLLNIVWDMGEPGATYQSHDAYFNALHPANTRHGMQAPMVYFTPGTKTVTCNLYRAGSTTPALSLTTTITVLDTATIPAEDTHFVSNTGFAGAPVGAATYDNLPAALAAAWAANAADPQRIVLRSGDVWEDVSFSALSTKSAGSRVIIETSGAGAATLNPVTQGIYFFGPADAETKSSIAIQNIDADMGFEGVTILAPDGTSSRKLSTTLVTTVGLNGYITVSRGDFRGGMVFSVDISDNTSPLSYDNKVDEHIPYCFYSSGIDGGGVVGNKLLRELGTRPNIAKSAWGNYRPDEEPPMSVNGFMRAATPTRYTIAHCAVTNAFGWALANPSAALAPEFPDLVPGTYTAKNPYPSQQGPRFMSSGLKPGANILIDGNEFEGLNSVKSTERTDADVVFSRNHLIGIGGTAMIIETSVTGAWFVANVFSFPDIPSEVADAKQFIAAEPVSYPTLAGREGAARRRSYWIGNTFRDLRIAGNLEAGDTGAFSKMFGNVADPLVFADGNVVSVPARTMAGTVASGFVKVDDAAQFSTEVYAVPFYTGEAVVRPDQILPFTWTPADIDPAYATPANAGHSLQPTGSATFLTAFPVGAFTPAYGMEGQPFSGATRPAGAWVTTA